MSDTVKLIIEIPKAMYESVQKKTYCGSVYPYLEKATLLDDVKAEINGLSGFYSQVTGLSEMETVRSVISDVNNIIDRHR